MTKEQQDIAWAAMPKEMRAWLRNYYRITLNHSSWQCSAYLRGRLRMMRDICGEHNLTSDSEPEEVLTVERKRVQSLHDASLKNKQEDHLPGSKDFNNGALAMLDILFGNKCLPDKEDPNSPNLSNSFQTGKNCLHTTERPEPWRTRPRLISLSDEELDNLIFELICIRDNRRENDRQLTEALAKLIPQTQQCISEREEPCEDFKIKTDEL